MIPEVKKLKTVADILNCEGPILRLHQFRSKLYLSSDVRSGEGGSVYYSTNKEKLIQYLNSEITLKQLYLDSDDLIVFQQFRNDVVSFIKEEFTDKISCGENFYKEYVDTFSVRKDILELVKGI